MRTLISFPGTRHNVFPRMLYSTLPSEVWRLRSPRKLWALNRVVREAGPGDVLHVQWTWPFLSDAGSPAQVGDRIQAFHAHLEAALRRGMRLVWHVHNVVSHDSAFPECEWDLNALLAEKAHAVVQLNTVTSERLSEQVALDRRKVVTIRHSSYLGEYPSSVTQQAARKALGISQGETYVGFVGQIRPYKGIETLLDAYEMQEGSHRWKLLVAGQLYEQTNGDIRNRLQKAEAVTQFEFVRDDELQLWFRAADVLVFPYREVLNSGSAYLSATFGRPVVLPDLPQFEEVFVEQEWASLCAPTGDAVNQAVSQLLPSWEDRCRSARVFAEENPPCGMAEVFRALLETL